ncbi:hypothetical protein F1880_004844 [Penicillium rolfsii]|nr:hypothetical protein F1880_004844 [Penicillium rolfsii]
MSHPTRESLVIFGSFVRSLVRVLFAIYHRLKKDLKPFLVFSTPVIKAFGLIFRLFEKKPPGWSISKFNRGGIRKLPIYYPNDFFSFVDYNILWSKVVAPKWKRTMLMRQPFVSKLPISDKFSKQKTSDGFAPAVVRRVYGIVPLVCDV